MESSNIQSNNENFQFDTSGGISVEEQQEILKKINSLSVEKGIVPQAELNTEAKKRGVLFPLAVNIAAIILLALGFFLLWYFYSRTDQDIREGSAVLDPVERKLIQEIRRETNLRLSEKEKEINDILSLLEEAGNEYHELQLSAASLSEAQKERADYLLGLQENYRNTLSLLHDEHAEILEASRMREQMLRLQAEERAKELSDRIEQSQASLDSAMDELERLSNEQERAAAAESQLGGYYSVLNSQINAASYDDAVITLSSIKNFLNSPVFLRSRSLEAGKQNQLAAVAILEKTLAEAGYGDYVPQPPPDNSDAIRELTEPLEQKILEQERTISALTAQDSEKSRIAADYEQTITGLTTTINSQRQDLLNRENTIQSLRTDNSEKDQQLEQIRSDAAVLQARNEELNRSNELLQTQIEAVRVLLQNQ